MCATSLALATVNPIGGLEAAAESGRAAAAAARTQWPAGRSGRERKETGRRWTREWEGARAEWAMLSNAFRQLQAIRHTCTDARHVHQTNYQRDGILLDGVHTSLSLNGEKKLSADRSMALPCRTGALVVRCRLFFRRSLPLLLLSAHLPALRRSSPAPGTAAAFPASEQWGRGREAPSRSQMDPASWLWRCVGSPQWAWDHPRAWCDRGLASAEPTRLSARFSSLQRLRWIRSHGSESTIGIWAGPRRWSSIWMRRSLWIHRIGPRPQIGLRCCYIRLLRLQQLRRSETTVRLNTEGRENGQNDCERTGPEGRARSRAPDHSAHILCFLSRVAPDSISLFASSPAMSARPQKKSRKSGDSSAKIAKLSEPLQEWSERPDTACTIRRAAVWI